MQDHRHGTTEIFQCLHLCTESALLKYFSGYVCVYWNSTTEIFQLLHACTETAPLKYFISYVRVLKVNHWNISVGTCVYWKCTTEIFQRLRACTETAPPKYFSGYARVLKLLHRNISGVACVYWNCSTQIFSVYPCVLKLHCTTEIFQCVPVCTAIVLHKYFSVNRSVLKYFNAYNYLINLQYWNISVSTQSLSL